MIRKAEKCDIPQIAEIYNKLHTMEEEGKTSIGWVRNIYPTEETAAEAIKSGDMYVLEKENKICAAARINKIQVPEYANASWKYKDVSDDDIMVLHTLVVDPSCSGKGYGTSFVKFYENYATGNNCHHLRMDTNFINMAARKLYAKLGYWEADVVPCMFNGISNVRLVCLEKKI